MTEALHILVVDDDPAILNLLRIGLTQEGYDVNSATNGPEALAILQERAPKLIVLDVLMPEMDGFEVCRRIRQVSTVPVILLTALGREEDVINGLDAGADEYVTKPFSVATLSARIRAVLRRVDVDKAIAEERRFVCDDGRLVIDFDLRQVVREGRAIQLSATEFRLLSYLIANRDRVVPHQRILEHVWGSDFANQTAYLRTYVGFLRRKIEDDHQHPRFLVSSHGVGYSFHTA
ncbi:MAG TPA: response regulator transcription factor [Chloroflexota bacterium]|nr:response regulator transcription factor [Chloroflexota bacterium]